MVVINYNILKQQYVTLHCYQRMRCLTTSRGDENSMFLSVCLSSDSTEHSNSNLESLGYDI